MKMNFKALFAMLILCVAMSSNVVAQVKIGYCNIQVVLAYMPEVMQMEQELNTFRQKCAESLQTKEKYAQDKYAETMEAIEKGLLSKEEIAGREQEIMKLQKEIQDYAQKCEADMGAKQQTMMKPVTEKLKQTVDGIAKEKGYTHVLNSMDAGGTSIILFAPEGDDITQIVMDKLGIKAADASKPAIPAAPKSPAIGGGK
ncbi:MAG: OmpH family outer membrane protein [Bacteroidia bacterium]